MSETLDYLRPKATLTVDTPIVLSLLASEKPNSPAAMTAGTSAELDCRLQADANPGSPGTNVRDLFRYDIVQNIDQSGLITTTVTVTPVKGDGTSGTPKVYPVPHEQNMDSWQAQASVPRTDGDTMVTITHASSFNVTISNRLYSNQAAGGDIIASLPPATVDFVCGFAVKAAHYLKVLANGTDTVIFGPAATSAPGGYIRSNELEDTLILQCFKAGEWNVVNQPLGSWSIDS